MAHTGNKHKRNTIASDSNRQLDSGQENITVNGELSVRLTRAQAKKYGISIEASQIESKINHEVAPDSETDNQNITTNGNLSVPIMTRSQARKNGISIETNQIKLAISSEASGDIDAEPQCDADVIIKIEDVDISTYKRARELRTIA